MSQNDMVIANQGFPAFRSDLNSALQALASISKGPSRPATVYAGQLWIDDDTPSATIWSLYLYDGTDDILLGYIDSTNNRFVPWGMGGSRVVSKAGAYTLAQSERGELHAVSHATGFTVTLLAAATATNGFAVGFLNTGAGDITLDGNASETIDGQTTLVLGPGQYLALICDGSNWRSIQRGAWPSGCRVARTGATDQTLTTGTATKVQWTVVEWDPQNEYDETTNYRFVAKIAGTYLVTVKLRFLAVLAGNEIRAMIYKNAAEIARHRAFNSTGATNAYDVMVTQTVTLAVSEYVEAYGYHDAGVNKDIEGDPLFSWMTVTRVA
jgi:hypothetical protein